MIAMGVMLAALAAAPADGTEPRSFFKPEMFETLVNPACSHCVDESRRRAGEHLTPIPTIETDWGPWLKAQPGTVAYAMVSKFRPQSVSKSCLPESRKTRPEPDPRLDAEERVFGLTQGGESRAWPLKGFTKRPNCGRQN